MASSVKGWVSMLSLNHHLIQLGMLHYCVTVC